MRVSVGDIGMLVGVGVVGTGVGAAPHAINAMVDTKANSKTMGRMFIGGILHDGFPWFDPQTLPPSIIPPWKKTKAIKRQSRREHRFHQWGFGYTQYLPFSSRGDGRPDCPG